MTTTEEITVPAELYAALAKFQQELPKIGADNRATVTGETKDGKKTSYSYNYANLGDLSPLVLPLLAKHGLAWTAKPTMVGNAFVLEYRLTHSSGQSEAGIYPLPDPMRASPQQLGSAITYARRYALCAVTGIAPGKDDDDAAASSHRPASSKPRTPEEIQADEVRGEITELMDAQQLNGLAVVKAYHRRFKVDIRNETKAENLREFLADLRKDPDTALALDPATGQPERAVKAVS